MVETTYTIMTCFDKSAAAGDLQIIIEAESHTTAADNIELPF